MIDTRELCRVVGAALHVTGIERYAARLVREHWLPRAGESVDAWDAATLVLAVAATRCPEDAPRIVDELSVLPLQGAQRFVQGHETWVMATAGDRFLIPATPRDALAEAIEYEVSGAVEGGAIQRPCLRRHQT